LPFGIPGIAEEIEMAKQQAAQPGRQSMRTIYANECRTQNAE
jgi:hypothetical protein